MKLTQAGVLAALYAALPTLATYFNGDKINGVPVITDLDVNNLAANKYVDRSNTRCEADLFGSTGCTASSCVARRSIQAFLGIILSW